MDLQLKDQKNRLIKELLNLLDLFDEKFHLLSIDSKNLFLESIQTQRISTSKSLKNSVQYKYWIDAQLWMLKNLNSLTDLNKINLIKINSILNNLDITDYREINVYAGNSTGMTPDKIQGAMENLFNYIQNEHLLIEKTLENSKMSLEILNNFYDSLTWICNQLINIHPFTDGNGRVTYLVVDYLLARVGLLPLTYNHKVKLLMMDSASSFDQKSLTEKTINLINNQLRSYVIFENWNP